MSAKKRGLGKGLNELLSATLAPAMQHKEVKIEQEESRSDTVSTENKLEVSQVAVDRLVVSPYQPRQSIRHEGLEELSESISRQGMIQPIVVRPKNDHYEIIAGERRWRAAQLAGLEKVPVIVRDVPDQAAMAMALIENIQRENLNAIEEAVALKRLSEELQLTHLQVAEAIGKSRTSVTNALRLLTLNPEVQAFVEEGKIEMGHARALLSLKGDSQTELARMIIESGLSVRETERLVNEWHDGPTPQVTQEPSYRQTLVIDPNIRRLQEDLSDKLGAPVKIKHGHLGKGLLVIRYNSTDELEGILAHIH